MHMPTGKRSPTQTAITLSLPKDLVNAIDHLAAQESRTRSNWVVHHLKIVIAEKLSEGSPEDAQGFLSAPGAQPIAGADSIIEEAAAAAKRKMQARKGRAAAPAPAKAPPRKAPAADRAPAPRK